MQLKIPLNLAVSPESWYDCKKKRGETMRKIIIALVVTLAVLLILLTALLVWERKPTATAPPETIPTTAPTEAPTLPATEPAVTEPVAEETEPPTEPPFSPAPVADTDPANWEFEWKLVVNDEEVDSFTREDPITFGDEYFSLPGVAGFRGGNYRTNASYGTVTLEEGTINQLWKTSVGFIDTADWIGCGWTGQPMVVQWDEETKAIMNLYEDKKAKEGLVEAIYPKLDGYIHFIDMEDGSYTRDPIYIGRVFKGSGALDPRGYPIVYVGAGLPQGGTQQSIFAVSLIDGSILYQLDGDTKHAFRYWYGFDGGPLVDAETDTLIWAGENAIIYSIKLNTQYDKAAGTLTMNPDEPVMAVYRNKYGRSNRFSGCEASVTAADQYLYLGDNSGLMMCVNANTMELVWTQELFDDINATPIFEWEEKNKGYLYAAPSVDYNGGDISIYKLDALTGEVVWSYDTKCSPDSQYPGGVMGSPILGEAGTNLDGMVIFSVGRTPSYRSGEVIAFDKYTGEILWKYETNSHIWSSPIALYTEDGKGYIFQVDMSGTCYLLDGENGQVVNTLKLGRTTEASPVAFDNRILIGTRAAMYLLEVK